MVVNPNESLMQSLGLVNPLSVAWDLVPWSFVIDWFTGIGTFLGGLTDMYGLLVVNPYSSYLSKCRVRHENYSGSYYGWARLNYTTWATARRDKLSIPLPYRPYLANFGNSQKRAANAASLLIQQLVRIHY